MGGNTLEPKVEDRKKFDIDLQYGQVREKIVADMLQDKKIEVKSERGMKAMENLVVLMLLIQIIGFIIYA